MDENGDKRQRHHGPRRGQRGGWRGRGREFERHSGMPRDTEKKVQSGWGHAPTSEEESRKEEEGATTQEQTEDQQVASPPAEAVEEAPVKTLDDYLAEKAAHKLNVSLPAPRRANEGVDESKWKNTVVIKRDEEEEVYFAINKEDKKKPQVTKQPTKVALPVEQTFFDAKPTRGGPREGGRGGARDGVRGGRGGRGRGGQRGGAYRGQSRAFAPNVNDASAFPILTK